MANAKTYLIASSYSLLTDEIVEAPTGRSALDVYAKLKGWPDYVAMWRCSYELATSLDWEVLQDALHNNV